MRHLAFFSPPRCNDRRGCPVAAIFRAHDWTKSSLEWSRGVEAESGCMPCEEDRREGRCSLRSLTPRYNRAGCTGKIMAVNLWTDSIGFHLSPSFLVAALHRDISSFRFHPLVWSDSSSLSVFLYPVSFFVYTLHQKSKIAIITYDLHLLRLWFSQQTFMQLLTDIKWW